jgi:hypothetical protein
MQLKLQRSQRAKGLTASKIHFCLDVRADYTPDERSNINKYRLGPQIIYSSRAAQKHLATANAQLDRTQDGSTGTRLAGLARGTMSIALAKMQLSISIASLGRGHHIECDDLQELLESEDTIKSACKDLTRYLEAAATFDGSEIVVEYVNGEEQVHVAQNAVPLIEYQTPGNQEQPPRNGAGSPVAATTSELREFGDAVAEVWRDFEQKTATRLSEILALTITPLQVRSASVVIVAVLLLYLLLKL